MTSQTADQQLILERLSQEQSWIKQELASQPTALIALARLKLLQSIKDAGPFDDFKAKYLRGDIDEPEKAYSHEVELFVTTSEAWGKGHTLEHHVKASMHDLSERLERRLELGNVGSCVLAAFGSMQDLANSLEAAFSDESVFQQIINDLGSKGFSINGNRGYDNPTIIVGIPPVFGNFIIYNGDSGEEKQKVDYEFKRMAMSIKMGADGPYLHTCYPIPDDSVLKEFGISYERKA